MADHEIPPSNRGKVLGSFTIGERAGHGRLEAGSEQLRSQGVRLSDWTAQDFSQIYVRYRPHLISHASKFLSNKTLIEEVVQDAFLYLMTALPDLDSEIGVLRFLKWKTRLLCLDAMRHQSSYPMESVDEFRLESSLDVADEIQRADDAAIVRLALAQLSPRHRQVLVSSLIEEKSTRQMASELGMTQNSVRQLLLRARKSFRQAFVGVAEDENLSVSQALKLASSRHARKLLTGASLVLLVGLPTSLILPQQGDELNQAAISSPLASIESPLGSTPDESPGSQVGATTGEQQPLVQETNRTAVKIEEPIRTDEASDNLGDTDLASANFASNLEGPSFMFEEQQMLGRMMVEDLLEDPIEGLNPNLVGVSIIEGSFVRSQISEDVTLVAEIRSTAEPFPSKIFLEDRRKGRSLVWLAETLGVSEMDSQNGDFRGFEVAVTDFLVGDFGGTYGNVSVSAPKGDRTAYLSFRLVSENGKVLLENVRFEFTNLP